ncbi:MAG: serine hydrolase [Clostridia bacterium]|nr:serine hydrolase [Clostridia bacterium]
MEFSDEYDSGGAGIITSVSDYAKFVNALANEGVGANGQRILSSAGVSLLKQNQLNEEQRKTFSWAQLVGYGYGLGVRTMMDPARGGSLSIIGEFGWGGQAFG